MRQKMDIKELSIVLVFFKRKSVAISQVSDPQGAVSVRVLSGSIRWIPTQIQLDNPCVSIST